MIDGADLLVRQTKNGVAVFFDEERAAALRLYADDANGEACFSFMVYAKDRTFPNYTSPAMRNGGAVLSFDNHGRAGGGDGKTRLCKEEFVSEKDFKDIDSLIAEGILSERDRRVPPDFVVNVFVEPEKGDGSPADATAWVPRDCLIRFNTRKAFWKYHLLGNMNRNASFIVDLDSRVEFEFCGDVMLPGNRPAKVFRSKELIPVLEKSTCRFQLREQGPGTGKVLVKRLPVASESRLGMEMIDGKSEIVAESFINC
ncbi:MAG TPA: hypothetical protein VFP33_09370 [Gallionella sp.]|nr:hypothetical protein [Gallionella sp.]